MFTQFFKIGMFEQIPDANRNMSSNVTTPESKNHAKELSQESTVLLKNDDNTLPLKFNNTLRGVLVLGNGKHAHDPITHGSGSGEVQSSHTKSFLTVMSEYMEVKEPRHGFGPT